VTTIDVGALEEFEDGSFRVLEAGGRQIGVVRYGDQLYALRNICPHQSAPVCAGRVLSSIPMGDRVGVLEAGDGVPVVACPWHGWEFFVDTGQSVWDPKYRVRSYKVTVEDGRVLLELDR
jgi:nitrite reductase/ring-hydroxylating ferredoxin subunit